MGSCEVPAEKDSLAAAGLRQSTAVDVFRSNTRS